MTGTQAGRKRESVRLREYITTSRTHGGKRNSDRLTMAIVFAPGPVEKMTVVPQCAG